MRYEKFLVLLFLLTLPFVNPWVRGDGVGYYAYARALLIEHSLHFENDWRAGNLTFVMGRVHADGQLRPDQFTSTGYVANLFSVGPAILWAPFLAVVHMGILGLNKLGAQIAADGFSRPYIVTMALATATYGFVGLYLAFCLARKYFEERWAFLGTIGIWFASSVPVYMYFNPSWSHAHSVFAVSLFLWYWHRTRARRTWRQWALLGLCSGLMINVYYLNGALLLVPLCEALAHYPRAWRQGEHRWAALGGLFPTHALYASLTLVALLPTFITRQIIFGSPLCFGSYTEMHWNWASPAFLEVLFSAFHGMFSWTPVLLPAVLGLVLFYWRQPSVAGPLLLGFLGFYYVIASYPYWHGLSSFGNRFFVSLTPVFVLGLTAMLAGFASWFADVRKAFAAAALVIGLFIVWNAGFVFQWGSHMIPARGPISWREMVRNQVTVVPVRLADNLKTYLAHRRALMEHIEQEDLKQLQSQKPGGG